jgi:hypothetical protein
MADARTFQEITQYSELTYVNLNQNLLRAVETSKSDARDASRHAQLEARLRSDLSSLRGERDEALGIAASLRRKVTLLDGDLQTAKQKVAARRTRENKDGT